MTVFQQWLFLGVGLWFIISSLFFSVVSTFLRITMGYFYKKKQLLSFEKINLI